MEKIKTFEEFLNENIKSINKSICPICGANYSTASKCISTHNRTIDDLKRGFGYTCKNKHMWTYDTKDGNVVTLEL